MRPGSTITRADVFRLAAESGLDWRTVQRAVAGGVDVLRAESSRERLREAAKKLRIALERSGP